MYKNLILASLILCSCSNNTEEQINTNKEETKEESQINIITEDNHGLDTLQNDTVGIETKSKFSSKLIYKEESGWGYQIFEGSKLLINQEHIPAIQGIQGFSSKEKAQKTATYILDQVDRGNFPPTLSKEILDSLEVL